MGMVCNVCAGICICLAKGVALVGSYDLLSICHGHWPIEALPKHVADEGSWRGVMTADSGVDVAE